MGGAAKRGGADLIRVKMRMSNSFMRTEEIWREITIEIIHLEVE
jgi:hypothetical protein